MTTNCANSKSELIAKREFGYKAGNGLWEEEDNMLAGENPRPVFPANRITVRIRIKTGRTLNVDSPVGALLVDARA